MALRLEAATEARREEIVRLFAEYTDAILKQGEEVRRCLRAQHYGDEAQNPFEKYAPPQGRLYIALWDDAPVGCVALRKLDEKVCEMKRLYVRPGNRGRLIGGALVERRLQRRAPLVTGRCAWIRSRLWRTPSASTAAMGFMKFRATTITPLLRRCLCSLTCETRLWKGMPGKFLPFCLLSGSSFMLWDAIEGRAPSAAVAPNGREERTCCQGHRRCSPAARRAGRQGLRNILGRNFATGLKNSHSFAQRRAALRRTIRILGTCTGAK